MELYRHENSIITSLEIFERLAPHIKSNAILYIESDVGTLGRLANPEMAKNVFLGELFGLFVKLAGPEGHVIVPTFSYSWGSTSNEKIFDVLKTRSKVGAMSEFARLQSGSKRTMDPMFSFTVCGKRKNELAKIENNSFGRASIFDKMLRENAYLISFGLSQYDPTFVHYVEQWSSENFAPCSYRSQVEFKGELISETGLRSSGNHFCFMRALGSPYGFSDQNLVQDLRQNGALKSEKFGAGFVHISDCRSVFAVGENGIKRDPYYFVVKE